MPEPEGTKAETEGTKPTLEIEGAKPTQEEPKPTLKYGEEDFQRAVSKGLESVTRQLSLQKAEADRAKAEAELNRATLAERDAEIEKLTALRFADDPEALEGYKRTKAMELKEKKLALKEAEQAVKDAEQREREFRIIKAELATELQKQYKVPNKVLQACTSAEQMRIIAESFPKIGEKPEVEKETPPKFDSGLPSGGGGLTLEAVKKMSPEERMRRASEIAKLPLGLGSTT